MLGAVCIWKCWAPLKCKIFAWLAFKYRLWTCDRRARHGLQLLPSPCYVCDQEEDNVDHILVRCVYAREVWHLSLTRLRIDIGIPLYTDSLESWWLRSQSIMPRRVKKGFDLIVLLVSWTVWKQRNARAFNNREQQCNAVSLVYRISDELHAWFSAGAGALDSFHE